MAQKLVVELVDDLDGTVSEDIATVPFGLDGAEYEIDLTEDNANHPRETLSDFVAAARRIGGRVKRSAAPAKQSARPAADREQTRAIHERARQNGFELSDRGRIASHVIDAFEEAQTAAATKTKKSRSKAKAKEPAFSA
jgi:hypothetical protein